MDIYHRAVVLVSKKCKCSNFNYFQNCYAAIFSISAVDEAIVRFWIKLYSTGSCYITIYLR